MADRRAADPAAAGAPAGRRYPVHRGPGGVHRDRLRADHRLRGAATRSASASSPPASPAQRTSTRPPGAGPTSSVNLITVHDGFTLADLISYNDKHNEANGENNQDGTSDNRSWNCGAEGPSSDPDVLALRARQSRAMLTTLMLSFGVPLLLGGDEMGRTQRGSNNAYCQDNEITWFDWASADTGLLEFTRRLITFRRAHPVFRRRRFLVGVEVSAGRQGGRPRGSR